MKKLILTTAMCLALSTHAEPKEHKDCLTKADIGKGIHLNIERILLEEIDGRHENIIKQLVKALNEQQNHFGAVLKSHMEHLDNAAQKITNGLIETNGKIAKHLHETVKVEVELNEKKMEAGYKAFKEYMDNMKEDYDKKVEEMTNTERAFLVEQLKKYCNCNNK